MSVLEVIGWISLGASLAFLSLAAYILVKLYRNYPDM